MILGGKADDFGEIQAREVDATGVIGSWRKGGGAGRGGKICDQALGDGGIGEGREGAGKRKAFSVFIRVGDVWVFEIEQERVSSGVELRKVDRSTVADEGGESVVELEHIRAVAAICCEGEVRFMAKSRSDASRKDTAGAEFDENAKTIVIETFDGF